MESSPFKVACPHVYSMQTGQAMQLIEEFAIVAVYRAHV